ncbi:hypothetical protein LCGC14_2336710, partial [marine sediment metagenome]
MGLRDAKAVGPLKALVENDQAREVQLAATSALVDCGAKGLDALAALMKRPDGVYSAAALGKAGDKRAFKPLMALLKHKDYTTRRVAVEALGQLKDPRAFETVMTLSDSGSGSGLGSAIRNAMYVLVKEVPISQLEKTLGGKSPSGREWAAMELRRRKWVPASNAQKAQFLAALGKLDELAALGSEALAPLLLGLKEQHWRRRRYAIEGLVKLGDKRAVGPLVQALKDPSHYVREHAARALGKLKDPRAVKPLIQRLTDRDSDVVAAAAEALGAIGDKQAVEPLIGTLRHDDRDGREGAATALGVLRDKRAIGPLVRMLDDDSNGPRLAAADALTAFGSEGAKALLAALRDPSSRIRKSAAHALEQMKWQPKSFAEKVQLLAGAGKWKEVVAMGPAAIDPLRKMLDEDSGGLAIEPLQALGEIRHPRAVDVLLAQVTNGPRIARRFLAAALGKSGDARAAGPLGKMLTTATDTYEQRDICRALVQLRQPGCAQLAQALVADDEGPLLTIADLGSFMRSGCFLLQVDYAQ